MITSSPLSLVTTLSTFLQRQSALGHLSPESRARDRCLRLLRFGDGRLPYPYIYTYLFVALEIGPRRLVHFNVTEHPTADWTLQQLRGTLPGDQDYKFLLHDRHKTFSPGLDEEVESWAIQGVAIAGSYAYRQCSCELLEPYVASA